MYPRRLGVVVVVVGGGVLLSELNLEGPNILRRMDLHRVVLTSTSSVLCAPASRPDKPAGEQGWG